MPCTQRSSVNTQSLRQMLFTNRSSSLWQPRNPGSAFPKMKFQVKQLARKSHPLSFKGRTLSNVSKIQKNKSLCFAEAVLPGPNPTSHGSSLPGQTAPFSELQFPQPLRGMILIASFLG